MVHGLASSFCEDWFAVWIVWKRLGGWILSSNQTRLLRTAVFFGEEKKSVWSRPNSRNDQNLMAARMPRRLAVFTADCLRHRVMNITVPALSSLVSSCLDSGSTATRSQAMVVGLALCGVGSFVYERWWDSPLFRSRATWAAVNVQALSWNIAVLRNMYFLVCECCI